MIAAVSTARRIISTTMIAAVSTARRIISTTMIAAVATARRIVTTTMIAAVSTARRIVTTTMTAAMTAAVTAAMIFLKVHVCDEVRGRRLTCRFFLSCHLSTATHQAEDEKDRRASHTHSAHQTFFHTISFFPLTWFKVAFVPRKPLMKIVYAFHQLAQDRQFGVST
jgi:hypothetical protein